MDHYVVTAVSDERNVSCNITSYSREHSCSVSLDGNVNDYNFTMYGVTPVNDSFSYTGSISTDCRKQLSLISCYLKQTTLFQICLFRRMLEVLKRNVDMLILPGRSVQLYNIAQWHSCHAPPYKII